MKKLYETRSSVSPSEGELTEGLHAIRTLERLKETISDLLGPMDSGMWKWSRGSDEVILVVNRWEDLGSDINGTGLVKLTVGEIESMIHPEDLQSIKDDLIAHMEGKVVGGLGVDFRIRGKSGDWRWVRVETEFIDRDHGCRPMLAIGCFADLSEVCAIFERLGAGERLKAVTKPQMKFNVVKSAIEGVSRQKMLWLVE